MFYEIFDINDSSIWWKMMMIPEVDHTRTGEGCHLTKSQISCCCHTSTIDFALKFRLDLKYSVGSVCKARTH